MKRRHKYEIVVCMGDEHEHYDDHIETVHTYKDARDFALLGAKVYLDGQHIESFIDHEAVNKAFDVIKGMPLNRSCFMWDGAFLDIEDVIDVEEAHKKLKEYGFKITEEWEKKVLERSECGRDPLTILLLERPRFLFKAIDIDELPF